MCISFVKTVTRSLTCTSSAHPKPSAPKQKVPSAAPFPDVSSPSPANAGPAWMPRRNQHKQGPLPKNNQLNFIDSWKYPEGYKSGVTIINKNKVLVCGYSGVDYSMDGGHNWKNITKDSYNTCVVSPDKKSVILVGNKGKIGKVTL